MYNYNKTLLFLCSITMFIMTYYICLCPQQPMNTVIDVYIGQGLLILFSHPMPATICALTHANHNNVDLDG